MWDIQNRWDAPNPSCLAVANKKCMGVSHPDPYSYVPTSGSGADPGISLYAQLIQKWEIATNVLQANEGPSFIAHQYVIAAQSGGVAFALSSPDAEAENPSKNVTPTPFPTGPTTEANSDIDMMTTSGCDHGSQYAVRTINMSIPAPTLPAPTPTAILNMDNGSPWGPPPCEEYVERAAWSDTILDEISNTFNGRPPTYNWQYIAHDAKSIWAAPLGVNHLYQDWVSAGQPCSPTAGINEPFICDEDAWQFIQDRSGSVPLRPFADLTYITPCGPESDHPEPNAKGVADGPEWLINLINAIGESPDWPHTAIFVVWDDWGGWYDHEPFFLNSDWVRPNPNPYNNPRDPNEWGFRVPLIVISPYIKESGYISNASSAPYKWRSQSVIMQFIEANFGLPLLNGDDEQQNQNDGLQDMFDMSKATPMHTPPIQAATSRRLLTPTQPLK